MTYKQLKKAFSRGLRGKTNNVPGFYGRIFHRIGVDAANGVELDYVKVEDCSQWTRMQVAMRKQWPYHFKISVIHDNKSYLIDLKTFFYAEESLMEFKF